MTTPQQDDNAWRRHEVPTYTEAQDTWLFGLSFRQLIAIAIGGGIGYGAYTILFFLDFWFRLGVGVAVLILSAAFVALKPGGRSLFSVLFELLSFQFRTKHYTDLTRHVVTTAPLDQYRPQRRRKQLNVPIPTPSNTIYIRLSLPIGGRRDSAESIVVGVVVSALAVAGMACSVEAQSIDNYLGKRVYLESVVVKYYDGRGQNSNHDATVRMKSAAPLRWAQPRLLESLQSVTEKKAHGSTIKPARRFGPNDNIPPVFGIAQEDSFVFESVSLRDRQERPYCDIPLTNGQLVYRDGEESQYFRQHTPKCRLIQTKDLLDLVLAGTLSDEGIPAQFSISRPTLAIQWEDIKRNKGSVRLNDAVMPYPEPSLFNLKQDLGEPAMGELLNPEELCDPREIKVLSLGIQTARPDDPGVEDYFEGRSGRQIAGEVLLCRLEDPMRVAHIGLMELPIFAPGNTEFEIKARAIMSTLDPEKIVNTATVRVLDPEDGDAVIGPDFIVPKMADADYDAAKPNVVKFIVPPGVMLDKANDDELDHFRIQVQIELEHVIKVKRPIEQNIELWGEYDESLIFSCPAASCGCSGGGCRSNCTSRSCNRSFSQLPPVMRNYVSHYDHYRVKVENGRSPSSSPGWTNAGAPYSELKPDQTDRKYDYRFFGDGSPMNADYIANEDSDIELTFIQTFLFEPIEVAFDRSFTGPMVYASPTPRAGRQDEPDYFADGASLGHIGGFLGGEELICGSGVGTTSDGDPTGWVWVEPATNSNGEAYGGCRRDYVCKLRVPPQEEIFGADGLPTEEDYLCLEYNYDDE